MSIQDSDIAVQGVTSQSESLTSLLREISLSLSAIKQQNEVLSEQILKSCKCHNKHNRRDEPAEKNLPKSLAPAIGKLPVSRGFSFAPNSLSPVTTGDSLYWTPDKLRNTVTVPYGEPSPLDAHTYWKFGHHFDTILEDSDLENRLNYLPPDDYRYQIPATRPNFLRNFMTEGATVPIEFKRAQKLKEALTKELDRFDDYQMRLGTGYFWIRDYDSHGSYMRWDCISPPKVVLSSSTAAEDGVSIPDSEWPIDWKFAQQDGTPLAPWRRIISCRGLAHLANSSETIQTPFFRSLSLPIQMHAHGGLRKIKTTDFKKNVHHKPGCIFQLTFATNYRSQFEDIKQSMWQSGSLYPGGQYQSTEFQSITIDALYDGSMTSSQASLRKPIDYWTILILEPSSWHYNLENVLSTALADQSTMQVALLALIGYALGIAVVEWNKMAFYFDTLMGDHKFSQNESTLLSPEEHDSLLFDDESFSRSRKYFWVVDALSVFIDSLSDSVLTWERYREDFVAPFLELEDWREATVFLHHLRSAEVEVSKLIGIRNSLEKHLERTKLLRDGLFNASAVIESRAASDLGFNVKLLTYVSIFYLPLSFCTSLWSTTDTFNFKALAIVMSLVGFSTYAIVFNLEHLAQSGSGVYRSYKHRVLRRMSTDLHGKTWADRANRFKQFEPDRRSTKPSDWYIIWAMILLAVRDVRRWVYRVLHPSSCEKSENQGVPWHKDVR